MRYYSRDGLTFDVDDSGPEGADLVVLLHGWPQDRTAWDKVTPLLTTTGVRVIAPDLRGYSPGARPGNHLDYEITEMVADVVALLDEVGAEQAHIVGHDWGGALAWAIAARAPERVATLTVLSTPSPSAMAKGVRSGDQLKHSWYMALFALPVLPVLFFRLFAQQILEKIGMPRERAAHDARRLKSPGAAEGTFAWYRAALSPTLIWRKRRAKGGPRRSVHRRVIPTAFVWGSKDPAFAKVSTDHTVEQLRRRAGDRPELAITRELHTGHWLMETHPEVIAEVVLERINTPTALAG
ncbi:alpha/beta fold hydrolase [Janibacter limosus]|uniref:Alpha/beta fold hydrolase n=1 Tax=Janibacter limosus TaxID=53458 RepID=A0A4P6MU30_9MICO|nr:alpha/beta fold hydrolase [Janibacter limosus]QBF45060.1 alpha/beta fold hydrolase [Janibacter limosus]